MREEPVNSILYVIVQTDQEKKKVQKASRRNTETLGIEKKNREKQQTGKRKKKNQTFLIL